LLYEVPFYRSKVVWNTDVYIDQSPALMKRSLSLAGTDSLQAPAIFLASHASDNEQWGSPAGLCPRAANLLPHPA
jgi:hypothetical protein